MKVLIFRLICALFLVYDVCGQNAQPIFQHSEDIEIKELLLPIHKSAQYKHLLWASDYGSGSIYKSTDFGKSFEKLITLNSEYFESIQFISEQVGFICGDYGYVYKTMDGGKTWKEISPPIDGRITEHYRGDSTKNQKPDGLFIAYYSMEFISGTEGFVSGYQFSPKVGVRASFERIFFSTTDAGKSWKRLAKSDQEKTIDFLKKNRLKDKATFENEYFISDRWSWSLAKAKNKSDIIVKKDYHASTLDSSFLPETPFERVMLRKIYFLNHQQGFIFGGSLDSGNQKAVIYTTTDGGQSWRYFPSKLGHIHEAIANETHLLLFGKEGLQKRIPLDKLD